MENQNQDPVHRKLRLGAMEQRGLTLGPAAAGCLAAEARWRRSCGDAVPGAKPRK